MTDVEVLKRRIIREIDSRKQELVELCSSLIRIPSENPPGDSTEISRFIAGYLKQFGFQVDFYEPKERMYNLVAGYGRDEGKHLILCGHTDVVPAGDPFKWNFPPFSGEVKDGWILGRGASDMKGGLSGIIFAVSLLKRLNLELPGKITLAIVPDEETGGKYGVPFLLENGIIHGDGCLIAEPSSPLNPTIGQKGAFWFKLTVFGEPGHGSLSPVAGRNAIADAIKAIAKIQELWELPIPVPDEVKPIIARTKRYMKEVEKLDENYQKVLERITVNVGTISGGTKSNVIPESCTVEVDCRLPFGITHEKVAEHLHRELDGLGIRYQMETFGFRGNANFTPPDDPVCRAVIRNISYVTGKEAYGVLQWASSDARHFRAHRIPVLQYGPAHLPSIHGYNEKVAVEDVLRCAKVYALAAIDFLFSSSR